MFLRPAPQMPVVVLPDALPSRLNVLPYLQLGEEKGRQNITHHITRADVRPGIFIHFPPEKTAAVRPFFTNDLGPLNQAGIVDQQSAALAAGDVLGFMKALGGEAAERAQ